MPVKRNTAVFHNQTLGCEKLSRAAHAQPHLNELFRTHFRTHPTFLMIAPALALFSIHTYQSVKLKVSSVSKYLNVWLNSTILQKKMIRQDLYLPTILFLSNYLYTYQLTIRKTTLIFLAYEQNKPTFLTYMNDIILFPFAQMPY